MPIIQTAYIVSSVGRRGVNSNPDVIAIQSQLNGQMNPPRVALVVDGDSGSKTRRAIRDFQRSVLGFRWPDGRVDPNGKTLAALNDPASEGIWAQMSIPPDEPEIPAGGGAGGPVTGKLSPTEREAADKIIAVDDGKADPDFTEDVLDELIKSYAIETKAILAFISTSAQAQKMAYGFRALKALGMSAKDAAIFTGITLKHVSNPGVIAVMDDIGSGTGKFARALKGLGRATVILAVVVTAAEVINHWKKGAYGAAAGEIYKLGMGLAIPWAGLVDAVQTIVEGFNPSLKGNRYWDATFRILRTLNPLGAGAVAVDSVVSVVQSVITSLRKGSMDWATLDKLVDRMHSGPLSVFAKLGEGIGDFFGDLTGDWVYENILKDSTWL